MTVIGLQKKKLHHNFAFLIIHVFLLQVIATELGVSKLSASADVIVNLLDINDNRPDFSQSSYEINIPENQLAGVQIGQVSQSICTHNTVFEIKKKFEKESSNLRKHFHDVKPIKIVRSIQILLLESKDCIYRIVVSPI